MPGSIAQKTFPFPSEIVLVARSILAGHGFSSPFVIPTGPTALYPPAWPVVLAGIFHVFGDSTDAAALAMLAMNCITSSLTCWAVYRLGQRTFGGGVGATAAWLWAVFPVSIFFALTKMGEASLSPLLLTLAVLIGVELEDAPALGRWAALGVVWGAVALINPAMLAVLPLQAIWLVVRLNPRGRRWVGSGALAAMVFAAMVAPWTVRNCEVFGRWIPFRSGFALELRMGNGPETDVRDRQWLHPVRSTEEEEKLAQMGEAAYMDSVRQETMQFIREHPGIYEMQTARRILYTWTGIWSLRPSYLRAHPEDFYDIAPYTLLTVLALWGLRLAFRNGVSSAPMYAAVLLTAPLAYYATHVQPRYRHPLDPFLLILAVYAWTERSRARRQTSSVAPNGAQS
jgi:4-amino-4-deoxy-L-arabinose transferase-like glycosyltransferase